MPNLYLDHDLNALIEANTMTEEEFNRRQAALNREDAADPDDQPHQDPPAP
jgi:hypothetical protein